jgi:uncharacterized protein YlxW (UPF0749 family)
MSRWRRQYPRDDSIRERLDKLEERIHHMEASQSNLQSEVDSDTAAIQQVGADLTASVGNVQSELDSLQSQIAASGVSVDLSGLEKAVADLDTQAKAVSSLAPDAAPVVPPASS